MTIKIDPKIVQNHIHDNSIELIFFEEISSTNTTAKELALQKTQPFLVFARKQNQGRGRMTRSWEMQADKDIVMSLTLPSHFEQKHWFSMIRLSALSVFKVLSYYTDQIQIKWPNDIITKNGQKICGILTENVLVQNQVKSIVIGIGININSENLPEYASSLLELTKQQSDINQIIAQICNRISYYWQNFPHNEDQIIADWENHLAWRGEIVNFSFHEQVHTGILSGFTQDGAIRLNINGHEQVFLTGDLSSCQLRNIKKD